MGQSILSKETTKWQGLGVEPPTFRSEVQRANHYTTAPPQAKLPKPHLKVEILNFCYGPYRENMKEKMRSVFFSIYYLGNINEFIYQQVIFKTLIRCIRVDL